MVEKIVKLPCVPFTVVNNSGTGSVFLYVHGLAGSGESEGQPCYLSSLDGDCTLFSPNTPYKPYGLELPGKEVKTFFPQLEAARIYISIGQLQVSTGEDSRPVAISADDKNTPNYRTAWDFAEATWKDYGDRTILHLNPTQVDAFGLALRVEHEGSDPADPSKTLHIDNGFGPGPARMKIIEELAKMEAPWPNLILGGKYPEPAHRVLMPLKAMQVGLFPKDHLDRYVGEVMAFYDEKSTNRLMFPYGGWTYSGHTTAKEFVFELISDSRPPDPEHAKSYTIPRPTTEVCYANELNPVPFDDMGRAISAALAASFMRSTLKHYPDDGFPVPQAKRKLFYMKEPINQYARIIHKYGLNNHAFCFGQDEVAGDAGDVREVANPKWMRLTVQKLHD